MAGIIDPESMLTGSIEVEGRDVRQSISSTSTTGINAASLLQNVDITYLTTPSSVSQSSSTPAMNNTAQQQTLLYPPLISTSSLNSESQTGVPGLVSGLGTRPLSTLDISTQNSGSATLENTDSLRFDYPIEEDEATARIKPKKPPLIVYREQDRFVPINNTGRVMRNAVPKNAKISKDAKQCMQECVSEFISFLTSEASDRCIDEKRKTITGDDILYALSTLGFDSYVNPLQQYLKKYREFIHFDKPGKEGDESEEQELLQEGNGTTLGAGTGCLQEEEGMDVNTDTQSSLHLLTGQLPTSNVNPSASLPRL